MNTQDSEIENINDNKKWVRNFSISLVIHLLILAVLLFMYNFKDDTARINSMFFTIDTKEFVNPKTDIKEENKNDITNQEQVLPNKQISESIEEIKSISFSDIIADTTNLDQVYTESTLNVTIKYPKGWIFLDQKKKQRLDGVTFWDNDGQYDPPPYIHLEVVNNDLFIEKRYLYKTELDRFQAYYNNPEEMMGYFTQVVYIRTGDAEDFRLKLMMKGKEEFYSFQPKFWAILKSFKFGSAFF